MQVGKAFVVILGKNYVANKENYELCLEAEKLNIPMYALVISGTNWDKFKKFPWRKVIYISNPDDLEKALNNIKKDLDFYYMFVGGP